MAREHLFEATLNWTGGNAGEAREYAAYSREWRFVQPGKPDLTGSAAVPFLGDRALPNPEDLLLSAVSACHLLTFLAEATRAGIVVRAYEDRCTARMTFKDGKMRITEVVLRPIVDADGDLAPLHHLAHEGCFIANSVNFPISIVAPV